MRVHTRYVIGAPSIDRHSELSVSTTTHRAGAAKRSRCDRARLAARSDGGRHADRALTRPTAFANASRWAERRTGSGSATLYVPAGASSAATTASSRVVHVNERDVTVEIADQCELPALRGGVEAFRVRAVGCHEHREAQHDPDAAGVGDTGGGCLRDGDRVRGRVVVPLVLLVDPAVAAVDVREGDRLLDEPARLRHRRRRRRSPERPRAQRVVDSPRRRVCRSASCRDVGCELGDAVVTLQRRRATAERSNRSTSTGVAPAARTAAAFSSDRTTAVT